MKKYIALLLAAMLCLAVFAGCASGDDVSTPDESDSTVDTESSADEEEQDSETEQEETDEPFELPATLIVGLDDTFAPMGFRDEANNLMGFDIDLANAVGEVLGIEIVFQPIDWDSKEMELEAENIDCIWNGMSTTPERQESMTLSQPYLNNRIVIMTNAGVEITSKDQLADYQIGTQAKSSALEVIQSDDIYEAIQGNLFEYRSYDECILDMQSGRLDLMVVDEVLGQYKNNNLDEKFGVSTVDFGEDYYVIGFRKGDDQLCKAIEGAIKEIADSGKGAEISEKWFGEDLLLPLN